VDADARAGSKGLGLVLLKWAQIDLKWAQFAVVRAQRTGRTRFNPLRGPEIRAMRRVRRSYGDSPYVFVTERKGPLTASGVRKILARAGEKAGLEFPVHPHMLRHGCGFKLASDGHYTQHYSGQQAADSVGCWSTRRSPLDASRVSGRTYTDFGGSFVLRL
jgi:integrase